MRTGFNTPLAFLRFAAMPLKLLWRGHLFFLAFAALFGSAIFFAFDYLTYFIFIAVRSSPSEPRAMRDLLVQFTPWVIDLCWLLMAPFAVVLVSKPVRTLWLVQNLASWELYKGLFRDVAHSLQSVSITIRHVLPLLLPVLAMAVLFAAVRGRLTSVTYPGFIALWAAVFLVCLYKSSVILSTPFISVLAGCPPREALFLSPAVSGGKRNKIFALWLPILMAIPIFDACGFELDYLSAAVLFLVLWYLGTLLAIVVMSGLMDYVTAELAAQQPPQSTPPPPPAIPVQVMKAWVKE